MTSTNKHGVDAYGPRADGKGPLLNKETLKNNPLAIEEWKGAPCPDTQELEQMRRDNKRLLNDNKRMAVRKLELCQERDELAAHIELIKQLADHQGLNTHQRWEAICQLLLEQTPSTSLQQHDNEVIERCAITVEGRWLTHVRKAIRALKTGE